MTGGSGHTGAYISRMGTKWNELDEEMEAREAVKEIIEKEVWNQIENSKESTAKEVMRKAHYLVDKGIIDPTKVTRSALLNAASISALFITTEAGVAEIKSETPEAPMMPNQMY